MKAIFKIIEYLPDTKQIVVRFARYNAPEPIDKYSKVAVDYSQLDFQDMESFTKSLMRTCGDDRVRNQENNETGVNEAETITGEFNLPDLVGRIIECKTDDYKRAVLKMRRVEL